MAYLYRHIRLDKNEVFYIGIGSDSNYKRANSIKQRNNHWKYIINNSKYKVDIILDNLTWEEACIKEKEFISIYGRKDLGKGSLVNFTDGGEGAYGRILSIETRNKISLGISNEKHGMFGKTHTQEAKEKISLANTRERYTKERSIKISNSLKDRKPYSNYLDNLSKGYLTQTKKVIDITNNIIYGSITEAAIANDIKPKTLSNYLNGIRKNKTSLLFLSNYANI